MSMQPDQAMVVRVAALKALASFLLSLESANSRQPFQALVPLMLQCIVDALAANDEDTVRSALEVFVEIAESQPKFLKTNLMELIQGMIQISGNTELDDSTRHLALEFLLTVAENSPATARKMGTFCAQVVPVALGMMLEIECDTPDELAEWENQQEDEEDTEITNYDVGEEALDRLAIALGGKTVVPVLFERIQVLIKSENWKHRHAALMAISQSGEGCEAEMRAMLEQIITMVAGHFTDPHPRVRWAAINTVGQMCTDFGPKLQEDLHQIVLPALIRTMDDGCNRVQAHAAASIINFCEHCSRPTLKLYLGDLLTKLMGLLQRNVRRVIEQAVTAIASVADVAEEDFRPYYASFMPGLKALISQPGNDKALRMMRGKAMECVSLIGVAVGKEAFGADAKEVMDLMIAAQQSEVLDSDDPQISYFLQASGRICKCLGEHFAHYLPHLIPPLLKSAQTDPELNVADANDDDEEEEADEGLESVTVNIHGQGHKRITIRTSALEEKATACAMLCTYAQEMKEGFLPYIQQVANVLVPLIKFQYMDDVRTGAMSAMPELLNCAIAGIEKGVPGADTLAAQLKDAMIEPILEQLKNEPDTETLCQLLDSWNELIVHAGKSEVSKFTPVQQQQAFTVIQLLLKEAMDRRQERSQGAEEEDEDDDETRLAQEENEEALIQTFAEAIGAMLKVYHSAVLPLFDSLLLPAFQAMMQPSAISADRVAALCVFDDIIEHCSADGGASRYVPVLFPAFIQYSQAEEPEVRQAAIYGLGVLAEHGAAADFSEQMQQQATMAVLTMVEHPHAFDSDNAAASDNGVSALSKLCRRSPTIAAAGYPRWLALLPLHADREEARTVHKQLVTLVEENNTALTGASHERLPDIICVFGQVLGTDLVEPEVGARIGNILKQVKAGLPQVLTALPQHPAFAKLTVDQKGQLEAALSS